MTIHEEVFSLNLFTLEFFENLKVFDLFLLGVCFKTKVEHKKLKVSSSKTLELTTLGSSYHIEMNPGEMGFYDRVVIQDVLKEMASTHTLTNKNSNVNFKGQSPLVPFEFCNSVSKLFMFL